MQKAHKLLRSLQVQSQHSATQSAHSKLLSLDILRPRMHREVPSWQWAQPQTERRSLVFSAKATFAVQLIYTNTCYLLLANELMYNFASVSLDSTHRKCVTWCDDVANSFVEALSKWPGTLMTMDHTGSSFSSASHVITFMELFFYRCRGCRANHPMLESWPKGRF